MLICIGGLGHRTAEPLANVLRPVVDVHATVIEPPELLSLEEVRLAVSVLESSVDVVWHTSPHAHVPWIIELDTAVELVIAPVLVATEEVCLPIVSPHHGGVHVCQASRQTQVGQRPRVAGQGTVAAEQPVLTTYEEGDLLVGSLVNGIDLLEVSGQVEPEETDLHGVARFQTLLVDTPEVLSLEDEQLASNDGDSVDGGTAAIGFPVIYGLLRRGLGRPGRWLLGLSISGISPGRLSSVRPPSRWRRSRRPRDDGLHGRPLGRVFGAIEPLDAHFVVVRQLEVVLDSLVVGVHERPGNRRVGQS